MRMKFLLIIQILLLHLPLTGVQPIHARQPQHTGKPSIKTSDMKFRDPFIFVDRKAKCYYLITSNSEQPDWRLGAYRSTDLDNWEFVRRVIPLTGPYTDAADWWAPDTYEWKGKHYIFVTVTCQGENRGTAFFRSDEGITGNYLPVDAQRKVMTPANEMALDAALYVDRKGQPWMLYSHEWLQCYDGEIKAQKLSRKDLATTEGDPITLFKASDAPWCKSTNQRDGHPCYVTDAPFIIRDRKSGHLIMIWSSFAEVNGTTQYVFAQAISESGRIEGPWKQEACPLNQDAGGHAMIFQDLEGYWRVSYHSPNHVVSPTIRPTVTLGYIEIENGRIAGVSKEKPSKKKH